MVLFYQPVVEGSSSSSSGSSYFSTLATVATSSSSRIWISLTPCVLRPYVEMPAMLVRINVPEAVMIIRSSSSLTIFSLTIGPFFSVTFSVLMPLPPRRLDAVFGHRRAFAVAFRRDDQHVAMLRFTTSISMTSSSSGKMDAFHAGSRTSHRADILFGEADGHAMARSHDDLRSPSVSLTPINSSSSRRLIAISPTLRIFA